MTEDAAEAKLKAKIVRVKYERGKTSLLYATSPDLKGLLVAEHTWEALERAIPQAITDLYAACGEQVVVTRLDKDEDDVRSWVAFPSEVAAQALAVQNSTRD
jgi:hypothetical protein